MRTASHPGAPVRRISGFVAVFVVLHSNLGDAAAGGTPSFQNVTCGSVFKLMNTDHKVRLHSHDIKYGTGSGQQSVTGSELKEDSNSNWIVKGPSPKAPCTRGEAIACGSRIRLEHMETGKNLHSHLFSAPLSEQDQEVSAYGENGEGDTGDIWHVICPEKGKGVWLRDQSVQLRHEDTSVYLAASGNSFGRPITGQMEIAGVDNSGVDSATFWQTMEGVFIHGDANFANLKEKLVNSAKTEL